MDRLLLQKSDDIQCDNPRVLSNHAESQTFVISSIRFGKVLSCDAVYGEAQSASVFGDVFVVLRGRLAGGACFPATSPEPVPSPEAAG